MESILSTECASAHKTPNEPDQEVEKLMYGHVGDIPFFFAGMAFMFSLSLYFGPIFDDVPNSLDPELIVIYITTSFLVIAVLPFLFKPLTKSHGALTKAAVIVVTVLAALHTAIVGVGYMLVERDRPQPWLLGVNLGVCAVPGLVYLLERLGNERKRKRKED